MSYGNGGYAGIAGTTTPQPQPQRQSLIADQMLRGDKLTAELHGALSELEARLAVITAPEPPSASDASARPASPVQLAAGLAELNARIEHACGRIHRLMQRIEL